jgi:hypothetical protein
MVYVLLRWLVHMAEKRVWAVVEDLSSSPHGLLYTTT